MPRRPGSRPAWLSTALPTPALLANAQQAKLAEAQATNNLVVAEPAALPEKPVRPRTLTNTMLAAIIGAMLAVGAAFLIEYLDDTVKTADDVERVTGLSTLGAIARLKEAGGTRQLIAWLKTRRRSPKRIARCARTSSFPAWTSR